MRLPVNMTKDGPVELHFRIRSSVDGDLLYPNILEDKDVSITKAWADDGKRSLPRNNDGAIVLPEIPDNGDPVIYVIMIL